MTLLVTGLILFLGVHLVPALTPLRARIAARLGEGRYKGAFTLASLAGLALIVAGYRIAAPGERLFAPFPAAIALAPYAMTLSFILFAAANMRSHLRKLVEHPMLLGLLVWALVAPLRQRRHPRHRPVRRVRRLRRGRPRLRRRPARGEVVHADRATRRDRGRRGHRAGARRDDVPPHAVRRARRAVRTVIPRGARLALQAGAGTRSTSIHLPLCCDAMHASMKAIVCAPSSMRGYGNAGTGSFSARAIRSCAISA